MMGSDDGLDFLHHPSPPHAKLAQGKVDQGLPAAAAATAEAAAVQSAASFSPTSNPNQNFSVVSEETNINSQCNMEWPSDWFVEEPRAIHQDWPMNNRFDVNMYCNIQQEVVDDSFQMDDILGEDIVYESHSSDESGSDFEEDVDWQKEGYTDVAELFPVPEEDELDEEPAVDKAALVREARSKAAKAKARKTRELKLRAAAGTE